MDELYLEAPSKMHEQMAIAYINEFYTYQSEINGSGRLFKYLENYDDWLAWLNECADITIVDKNEVPSNTFFVVRKKDAKIVGMINIRHFLNERLLKEYGHIGYAIRPTERRKGYGVKALSLALSFLKDKGVEEVLVTCDKSNEGSSRTIIRNGGIYDNEIVGSDGILVQRYWINL